MHFYDEDVEKPELLPEHDFRFFKYSKLALPFLLVLLGVFTALLVLTMWQSRSTIQGLEDGIPRDIQLLSDYNGDFESGIRKNKRSLRFAVCFLGIFLSLGIIAVYFADVSPVLRARLNYPLGLILVLVGILALVSFGLNITREKNVKGCFSGDHMSTYCELREDLGVGGVVFDMCVAVFAIVAGLLVLAYTATGDWCRELLEDEDAAIYGMPQGVQPGQLKNGISRVRKTITMLAIVAVLISSIILLIFALLIHEQRELYTQRDSNNRPTGNSGTTTQSGWPLKNTKLRYCVAGVTVLALLFNLIPLTSRVIAYILGFLYIIFAVLAFAAFGVDIGSVEDAKDMECPVNYKCTHDAYNATIVLEFIGGVLLLIYVIWEFFISKKEKAAAVPPPPAYVEQPAMYTEAPVQYGPAITAPPMYA